MTVENCEKGQPIDPAAPLSHCPHSKERGRRGFQRSAAETDPANTLCGRQTTKTTNQRVIRGSRAYTQLRTIQNGLIRYAERLNFCTLISANLFRDPQTEKTHVAEFEKALKTLPTDEARERFENAHIMTTVFIVDYIVRNSGVVWVFSSIAVLILRDVTKAGRRIQ